MPRPSMHLFASRLPLHHFPNIVAEHPLDLIAECLLAGGAEMHPHNVPLQISRPRRGEFLKGLTDYSGGSIR